jgi:uncharacterized membrane protein YtjA (UPF0391 family)
MQNAVDSIGFPAKGPARSRTPILVIYMIFGSNGLGSKWLMLINASLAQRRLVRHVEIVREAYRQSHNSRVGVVTEKSPNNENQTGERNIMLSWAITFLIIALIAAVLGVTGIAGAAVGIAKILFVVFLVLFLLALVFGRGRVV